MNNPYEAVKHPPGSVCMSENDSSGKRVQTYAEWAGHPFPEGKIPSDVLGMRDFGSRGSNKEIDT